MFWSKIISPIRKRVRSSNVYISDLVLDQNKFDNFVYTKSLEEAVEILKQRRKDTALLKKVRNALSDVGIPEPFIDTPRLVIFRQLATPNLEMSRFIMAVDAVGMEPLFLEYFDDKFTPNNELKKYLGKIAFYEGVGKKGGDKITYNHVIDFNKSNGKKIGEVETIWGTPLKDFHHSLFNIGYSHIKESHFYDGSNWFKKAGNNAKNYYHKLMILFLTEGILFENFSIDQNTTEHNFSKEVFLPAFIAVYKKFGIKPLIVPLTPTSIENAEFWLCQNPKTHNWFKSNMLK